ncbi:hypothetical protein [Gaoshiqia sediminis]|uniref:Uncharacterized protein n=1 Tax=Gaoshiqia sediminis TaxID=2986998 RepID=A0AA42CA62_9BACT|nr:hypothetical protein [Gaoshiqia sediminis]MCW0484951.1 hypothetical protein [Gaoshiqia sediminis]
MKQLILLIFFLMQFGFIFGQVQINTEEVKRYFTPNEQKELGKVVAYVDSIIYSKTKIVNIDSSYHQYFEILNENAANGNYEWAFNEEMKYKFLFGIDPAVYNKIWIKETPRMVRNRDTTLYNPEGYISIDLNHMGDFVKLLKNIGDTSSVYKEIQEQIEIVGGLPPSLVGGFLYNHKIFNFNNKNDHLWAAIFLLTLEESVDKKLKRYLNE